jgi:amidase
MCIAPSARARPRVGGLVEGYFTRAKAYDGVSNQLVTLDGAPVPRSVGVVRAGAPLEYPSQTVKAATLLPNLDQYGGPPIEYGRMEATASDPAVQQQYGITVGMPNAGQVNPSARSIFAASVR